MIKNGYLKEDEIKNLLEESKNMIDEKFDERLKIPPPDPSTLFDDVYSHSTWVLDEEKGDIIRHR